MMRRDPQAFLAAFKHESSRGIRGQTARCTLTMQLLKHLIMKQRTTAIIISFLCWLALSSCGYMGYYASRAHWNKNFDTFPSMFALNKIDPEDSLLLRGSIIRRQPRPEPLLVIAVSNRFQKNEKVALAQLSDASSTYWTFLPRGEYTIYVYADIDQDGTFQTEECVGWSQVLVTQEQSHGGIIVDGPAIVADSEHPVSTQFRVRERVRPNSYVYTSLDDDFFDPRYGSTGLYQPSEFIAHSQGFLFSLAPFNRRKTTVLFVHGILGVPRDWKYIVEGLDQDRFQPFFFYYPSGLRLDKLGTLLAEMIIALDRHTGGNHASLVIAAHSMGGLIAVSAIQKLAERNRVPSLKLFCSFSTPYAGDESAKKWVPTAPVVVPSWQDVAAESDFLNTMKIKAYPAGPPLHLFFSYYDKTTIKIGESSDGIVSLHSQLDPLFQQAATRIYGFRETHDGILHSEAARSVFLRLLDAITPPVPDRLP